VGNIEINGKKYPSRPGATILSVLREHGIRVPSLCNLEELLPTGACRLCVVEVEGMRTLVPSCSFPVADNMKIQTHSPRVLRARKTIVELLLANHPDDCLYCVRNNNCELQKLAFEMGVRERRHAGVKHHFKKDVSGESVCRDPEKCILCGRCVRVCEEIQTVSAIDFIGRGCTTQVGTAFNDGLNVSTCINCGQCIMVCPTGALTEQSALERVEAALADPECFVVAQHAPSISVTLGEEFGMPAGFDVCGSMTAALRDIGFKRVFDTGFSADLTIMEEASELVHRIKNGGKLPMLTSCSPGWIKFVEHNFPEFIGNVSTCKSPQQMMGAIIKSYYARMENIDPSKIFTVSIMPCTAKKFEAARPEMENNGNPDVDAVITTRELVRLFRKFGVAMEKLDPEPADSPLGSRSTAGKLFGATGGVMEAAIRTAHWMLTGKEMDDLVVSAVRDLKGIKEAKVEIDGLTVGVAAASGLGNARKVLDQLRSGRSDLHFIEIMTCPNGCIAGGGQPIDISRKNVKSRMKKLYDIDAKENVRTSHSNPQIKQLYDDFLGEPLGGKSHELLHTHYHERTAAH
jgi:iron-only hydrogenase group A